VGRASGPGPASVVLRWFGRRVGAWVRLDPLIGCRIHAGLLTIRRPPPDPIPACWPRDLIRACPPPGAAPPCLVRTQQPGPKRQSPDQTKRTCHARHHRKTALGSPLTTVGASVWSTFRSWSRRSVSYGSWPSSSSETVIRCGHRSSLGPAAARPPGSRLSPEVPRRPPRPIPLPLSLSSRCSMMPSDLRSPGSCPGTAA